MVTIAADKELISAKIILRLTDQNKYGLAAALLKSPSATQIIFEYLRTLTQIIVQDLRPPVLWMFFGGGNQ